MTNAIPGIQTINVPVLSVCSLTYLPYPEQSIFVNSPVLAQMIDNDLITVIGHIRLQIQRDISARSYSLAALCEIRNAHH